MFSFVVLSFQTYKKVSLHAQSVYDECQTKIILRFTGIRVCIQKRDSQ